MDTRERILNHLLPEVKEKVKADFAHYGDTFKELGLPGQYADIWRKVGPLKRQLWDGHASPHREDARTICLDLIGHCLLTIAMLDEQKVVPTDDNPPPGTRAHCLQYLDRKGWKQHTNGWWHRGAGPGPAVQYETWEQAFEYQRTEDVRAGNQLSPTSFGEPCG